MTRWLMVFLAGTAIVVSTSMAADTKSDSRRNPKSDSRKEGKDEDQKVDASQGASRYQKMSKALLQDEIKRLQKEVLAAERKVEQAKNYIKKASDAYEAASDEDKPEALIRLLDAKAAARKPCDACEKLKKDFLSAQAAYIEEAASQL